MTLGVTAKIEPRLPARHLGFTSIELVVVVAISALLAYVGISQLPSLSQPFDRMMARSYLAQDIKRAQAEAVKWGCRGIFEVETDSTGYTFGCDFLPTDTSYPPSSDNTLFTRKLPPDVTLGVSAPIIFSSRGQSVDAYGDFTNVTITLYENSTGSSHSYATGILLGTGAFSFSEAT